MTTTPAGMGLPLAAHVVPEPPGAAGHVIDDRIALHRDRPALVAALAAADLAPPIVGALRVGLAELSLVQARTHDREGCGLVVGLRALRLTAHDDPGRDVSNLDRA